MMRNHPIPPLAALIFTTVLACPAAADDAADTLAASITDTKEDIRAAMTELHDLRANIARDRQPLAAKLAKLEREVAELRAKVERRRRLRREGELQYEVLKADVSSLKEEYEFAVTLLREYRRSLETRAGTAESEMLRTRLAKVDAVLSGDDEDLPAAAAALLDLSADWNEAALGGVLFDGAALDENGVEYEGTFAVVGPVAYFSAAEGPAGIVVTRLGSSFPSVFEDLTAKEREAVRRLTAGETVPVPVDVSGGDAVRVRNSRKTLWQHLKAGGFVMIPLAVVFAWALILAIVKFAEVRALRVHAASALENVLALLAKDDVAGARDVAAEIGRPLSSVILEAIEHRDAPRERIEEIMHEQIAAHAPGFEKRLAALAVLGGVAPLLGLLGTVTGMIHTFELVTVFGTGDPKLLSGGISEALVTTEMGLVIAIPVLLVHAYLSRRVNTQVSALEQTVSGFVGQMKKDEAGK